uniref:Uncharacterized protein n=1 Tax=Zea mays TaxID=4577 RepID=C0PI26_MAIZE|nr:unknown [Zea mays]
MSRKAVRSYYLHAKGLGSMPGPRPQETQNKGPVFARTRVQDMVGSLTWRCYHRAMTMFLYEGIRLYHIIIVLSCSPKFRKPTAIVQMTYWYRYPLTQRLYHINIWSIVSSCYPSLENQQ